MRLSEFVDNEILKKDIDKLLKEGERSDTADEIMSTVKKSQSSRIPKEKIIEKEKVVEEVVEEVELPNEIDRANRYFDEEPILEKDDSSRVAKQGQRVLGPGSGMGPKAVFDSINERAADADWYGSTIGAALLEISATSISVSASEVFNDSDVPGETVLSALDHLHTEILDLALSAGAVTSVFGRAGAIIASASDYDASFIQYNESTVSATLNDLDTRVDSISAAIYTSASFYTDLGTAAIGDLGTSAHTHTSADIESFPVDSVFGRYGAVSATSADYDASFIQYNYSTVSATLDTPLNGVVYVSVSGDDSTANGTQFKPYKTIKAANASITDNSTYKRYVVSVAPGRYDEDNPIAMKPHVNIVSIGQPEATRVNVLNDNVMFWGSDESEIWGFTLYGTTSGDHAVLCMSGTGVAIATHNHIKDSNIGFCTNNIGGQLDISDTTFLGTVGIGIRNIGGTINIQGLFTESDVTMDDMVLVSGSNSRTDAFNVDSDSPNVTNVIRTTKGAEVHVSGLLVVSAGTAVIADASSKFHSTGGIIEYCTSAFVAETSAEVGMFGISIENSTSHDLVAGSNSTVRINGCKLREDKIFLDTTCDIIGQYISEFPGDEGTEIKGELHVGSPQFPKESVFGEGDSYVRGMLVYGYNASTSAYTDLYTSASVAGDGKTFTFPTNVAESCLYFASDLLRANAYFTHLGVKLSMTTSAGFLSGTDVAFEYWNGSVWSACNFMITDSNSPYYPYAKDLAIPAASYQIRYDNWELKTLRWNVNDPIGSGTDRYWFRWRIISPFDTLPYFDQVKLHSNRMEINNDGWPEFFGRARPSSTLPWSWALAKQAATVVGNQDLYLSDTLDVGYAENLLNTNGDRVGFNTPLPLDCDTSTPIKFAWSYRAEDSGQTIWTIRWGYSTEGDTIYKGNDGPTSADTQKQIIVSATDVSATQVWAKANLDISNLRPRREGGYPDTLWVTVEATDRSGDVAGIVLDAEYTQWCQGGHVDNDSD